MERNIAKEIRQLHKSVGCKLKQKTGKPELKGFTEMMIVKHLIQAEEPVYQKDLVEATKLTKSSIAEQLDRMEEKKIIKRIVSKEDNRKKQIVLTKKALNRKEEIDAAISDINKTIVKGITKKDLEVFFKVLDKMKRNIG